MRLGTTKEKLLSAVLIAERITGKKETLPVLSCILFEVGKKEVVVRATNLEAGIEVKVPCETEEQGIVAVPAGVLSQTLRSIGGEKLMLKTEDGNLVVESKGTKTLIKAIPHEEFPSLAAVSDKKGITFSRERLIRSIQSVSYAASPSMIRPELGSIYLSVKDGTFTAVATDSFRLAEKSISGAGKESVDMLIPLRHALELTHVLERSGSEEVILASSEAQLTVSLDGTRFVSRVVEGNFPNYKEIIPRSFTTEATILKNDFLEMLKKARVFSGGDQHVGLHVYPKKKIFSATARSNDVGEMSDTIDAALSGDDLDINFHVGYLADCLPVVEADSIVLGFSGPGKPVVIRGVSDPAFTYLVMPLNR
jgi:DNA polymerase III subunit beta